MSKESIIKDLPVVFVRQMRNWVLTKSSVGLYTITPAYEGMPGNPTYGARVLSTFREVSLLEHAIDALPNRERLAVRLFWVYEGNDLVWLGRRLACDYRVAEKRVRHGHDALRADLARREHAYEQMAERQRAYA